MSLSGLQLFGAVWIAAGLLLAPGGLLLLALEHWAPRSSLFTRILAGRVLWTATALALSLSLLPLLWMGVTLIGLAWSPLSLSLTLLLMGVGAVAMIIRRGMPTSAALYAALSSIGLRQRLPGFALAVVLLVSCALRFWAVRDLAYPAWVDSPHHDLIVRLLTLTGVVPDSYDPLMPVAPFSYHFGFHAVAAAFVWLTGIASPTAILILGQLLNGLMPLSAYALTRLTTRRVWPAVAAAAIVGLVSMFPGYYVAWGRYTQLTGLVVLGPLLGLLAATTERLSDADVSTGSKEPLTPNGPAVIAIGLLSAGLVYAHYRVLAFAVTFALAVILVHRRLAWRVWLPAAGLGLLASAPWLWRVVAVWIAPRVGDPGSYLATSGYNDFPWQYFAGWIERAWWGVAAVGAATGLVKRDRAMWLMVLWTALTAGLLNIPGAGSWVVNNNSWAISVFLPGSVAAGYGLEQAAHLARWLWRGARGPVRWQRRIAVVWALALALLITAGLVLGGAAQARIVNPRTVLALPADRAALAWVNANVPRDAVFVVNSWYWQEGIWSASDGGIWLWTETGRRTTTPPADYYFDKVWTKQINDWNARWSALTDLASPEARALLREAGATHLYLGAVPGRITTDMVATAPDLYQPVYAQDGVHIYRLAP